MQIINAFRSDRSNAGDWFSPPHHYFPEFSGETIDTVSKEMPKERSLVIIGGGGLISPKPAFQRLRRFFGKHLCVGWGLGENIVDYKNSGYLAPEPQKFPDWLQGFDLLGLRDYQSPYHHVPCASCLNPVFDNVPTPIREIGFYCHKRIPLATGKHPFTTNDGDDLERKVRFIAECEVVVTNSYHGAFWAMLLNRKVICAPFGSKFFGLHPDLRFCPPWDIDLTDLESLGTFDGYLAEARQKNHDFAEKVRSLLA
jgi:hypothetical protein